MTSQTIDVAVKGCACVCNGEPHSCENDSCLADIITEYSRKPGGLIPALQMAQALYGYLPEPALRQIATGFHKTLSEVTGVATFYSFFSLHPRGRYVVRVCLGTACYVRGGKAVLNALKKKLAVEVGETTPDGLFTLEAGRCFGACGMAPVIMINDVVYQRVKEARVGELINKLIAEASEPTEKEQA